jgi:DNA-binding transcriptional LysR family regulator
MPPNLLDGVLAFTEVAERRSFTAAARELGVTPAAVSWTVKQLEARVGAPLLTRTTRSVGLTEAGALFLARARTGVAEIAAGVEAARRLGASPSGLLRLNIPAVGQALLEPVLPGFVEAYPEVTLELFVEDRSADIVAEGFDAGLRLGEMISPDMVAVRLTPPSRFAVVGAPGYFARRGRPERPEELGAHACINFRQSRGALYRWEFEEGEREFEIAVQGPLIVNGSALMLSAAVSGLGLAYTMADTVAPLVDEGLLETCLEGFMPENPGFYLYFPSRAQVMPKLRAFIDFVTART